MERENVVNLTRLKKAKKNIAMQRSVEKRKPFGEGPGCFSERKMRMLENASTLTRGKIRAYRATHKGAKQ